MLARIEELSLLRIASTESDGQLAGVMAGCLIHVVNSHSFEINDKFYTCLNMREWLGIRLEEEYGKGLALIVYILDSSYVRGFPYYNIVCVQSLW